MRKWHWISLVATAVLIAIMVVIFLPSKVEIMTSEGILSVSLSRVYAAGEDIAVILVLIQMAVVITIAMSFIGARRV